jgi:hypothetical protein
LDNGIGLTRNFLNEWEEMEGSIDDSAPLDEPIYLDIVTGTAIAPVMRRLASSVHLPNLHLRVVPVLNEHFGYLSNAELQVLSMPRAGRHHVIMLLEMQDSITPALFLYTMGGNHHMIDQLCIYEEKAEDRPTDFGKTFMDYYITSNWEITLMKYYLSHEATSPELEETRRYVINKEGRFEDVVIEL